MAGSDKILAARFYKSATMVAKKNIGSSFDDFLAEDRMLEEVTAEAIKRVLAWQINQAMLEGHITKSEMARRMQTSRGALDRLLEGGNTSVTLKTMTKAASVLGKRIQLELVPADNHAA